MESAAASAFLRPSFWICHQNFCPILRSARRSDSFWFGMKLQSLGEQRGSPFSRWRPANRKKVVGRRKSMVVRASSSSSESSGLVAPIVPLKLESPIGQFLLEILANHPHLMPAAVVQQLEQLQTDRDAEKKEEASSTETELDHTYNSTITS